VTTIAAPGASASQRPRRAGLAWNSWRLHRLVLAGLAVLYALCAVRIAVTGLQTHAAYASFLNHRCLTSRHPICSSLISQMGSASWVSGLVPWLVGVFAGAPLAAREFETGTYRFSRGQGVSGGRQLVATLVAAGALLVVASSLLGALTSWAVDPLHRISLQPGTGLSYWWPDYFGVTAVMLPALTLLDFSLGVLAGTLIRRTIPSMAAALAAAVAATGLVTGFSVTGEGSYGFGPAGSALLGISAVTAGTGTPYTSPPGSLLLSSWYASPDGRRLAAGAAAARIGKIPARVMAEPARQAAWLVQHHVIPWAAYQPADRLWVFQAVFAAVVIAAALAASAAGVWLAGRRA
jgi:hypothetical protein